MGKFIKFLKGPSGDEDANLYWYINNWIRFGLVFFTGFGICACDGFKMGMPIMGWLHIILTSTCLPLAIFFFFKCIYDYKRDKNVESSFVWLTNILSGLCLFMFVLSWILHRTVPALEDPKNIPVILISWGVTLMTLCATINQYNFEILRRENQL